jgi:hypothetical protein
MVSALVSLVVDPAPAEPAPPTATRRRRVAKVLGCTFLALAVPAGLLALFLWWFTRDWQHDLEGYRFEPDVEIRLIEAGDLDHDPGLFYEVLREGRIVSPPWYLGQMPGAGEERPEVIKGTSFDGSVVGIWFRAKGRTVGRVILFDRPSNESFPRLDDADTLLYRAVREKWRARYARLRVRYPELPPPEELMLELGDPEP